MFNLFNCQLLYIKSDLQIKMPRIKKNPGHPLFFLVHNGLFDHDHLSHLNIIFGL